MDDYTWVRKTMQKVWKDPRQMTFISIVSRRPVLRPWVSKAKKMV